MKHLILFLVFAILFATGCQKENSLVSPEESSPVKESKPAWQIAAEKQGLTFLQMPGSSEAEKNLSKLTSCTKFANVNSYTILAMGYKYYGDHGKDVSAFVTLTVRPYSLEESQWLTMSFTDDNLAGTVDLTFGPHGTTFLKPALLNVVAYGLDFSGWKRTDRVNLMYYNEGTGRWEKMPVDRIEWNFETGYLLCINGQLPHFSRYGFTR